MTKVRRYMFSLGGEASNLKGMVGEFVAEKFLQRQGFKIVPINVVEFSGTWGSRDIQAEKNGKRYNIEVKYGRSKLTRIDREELLKSKKHGLIPVVLRVSGDLNKDLWKIRWIEL